MLRYLILGVVGFFVLGSLYEVYLAWFKPGRLIEQVIAAHMKRQELIKPEHTEQGTIWFNRITSVLMLAISLVIAAVVIPPVIRALGW